MLKTISSPIEVVGLALVVVNLPKRKPHTLKVLVVKSPIEFMPLLGRDWLDVIVPHWRQAFTSKPTPFEWINLCDDSLKSLKEEFPNVFSNDSSSFNFF